MAKTISKPISPQPSQGNNGNINESQTKGTGPRGKNG